MRPACGPRTRLAVLARPARPIRRARPGSPGAATRPGSRGRPPDVGRARGAALGLIVLGVRVRLAVSAKAPSRVAVGRPCDSGAVDSAGPGAETRLHPGPTEPGLRSRDRLDRQDIGDLDANGIARGGVRSPRMELEGHTAANVEVDEAADVRAGGRRDPDELAEPFVAVAPRRAQYGAAGRPDGVVPVIEPANQVARDLRAIEEPAFALDAQRG